MQSTSYPCQIVMKLEFNRQIFEKYSQTPKFMKILIVTAEFFHVDGQTDRQTFITKLKGAFCNFAKMVQFFCRNF
jgi:hypothetical protein